jgi:hypothetical protein
MNGCWQFSGGAIVAPPSWHCLQGSHLYLYGYSTSIDEPGAILLE